jgi:hypothetical protein
VYKIQDCHPDDRIWLQCTLMIWGMRSYSKLCRACMPSHILFKGAAASVEEGVEVEQYLKGHGLAIDDFGSLVGKKGGFDFFYKGSRYAFASLRGLRKAQNKAGGTGIDTYFHPETHDTFVTTFFDAFGANCQAALRAQFGYLMMPLRKELVYLRLARDRKQLLDKQILGLFVALMVGCFQLLAAYLATTFDYEAVLGIEI